MLACSSEKLSSPGEKAVLQAAAVPGKEAPPASMPDAAAPAPTGQGALEASAGAEPADPEAQKPPEPALIPPAVAEAVTRDGFAVPHHLEASLSGLKYALQTPGTGEKPKKGEKVAVHYSGWLADGKKFDKSEKDKPLEWAFGKGGVIDGLDEGVGMMPVGSKAFMIIPPDGGYGEAGSGADIPANATLFFQVERIAVK